MICEKVCRDFRIDLVTVASYNHNISSSNHFRVGAESQETDINVYNMTKGGDIVVTQDYGLAALVLARGAAALSPGGKVYRQENINFLLEERDIKARFRRTGGRTKGPKKRTAEDDRRFQNALTHMVERALQINKNAPLQDPEN